MPKRKPKRSNPPRWQIIEARGPWAPTHELHDRRGPTGDLAMYFRGAYLDRYGNEYTPQWLRARGWSLVPLRGNPSPQVQQRRAVERLRKRQDREAARDRTRRELAGLKLQIHAAQERKRAALKAIREGCRRGIVELRDRKAKVRELRRMETREILAGMLEGERARCSLRKQAAVTAATTLEAKRRARLREARSLARALAGTKRRAEAALKRTTAAERRSEADDDVRHNLHPEMVPVFNAVRRQIKGSAHRSRTEEFLEWAAENPDEVWAMREASAARDLEKMIRAHERAEREAVPF